MNAEERARALGEAYWLEARGFPDPHEFATEKIAAAIREAEREALEAAAKVADAKAAHFDFESNDPDKGNGARSIARAIRALATKE